MSDKEILQEGRGRSALKRAAKEVETLAAQLVDLPESDIDCRPIDGTRRRELELARHTKGHGARRRQIKHFAGCLRRDVKQQMVLKSFLEIHRLNHAKAVFALHDIEKWRDRLCDTTSFAATLDEIQQALPEVDAKKLANLAHSVHKTGDKRAAREIFRRLREAKQG